MLFSHAQTFTYNSQEMCPLFSMHGPLFSYFWGQRLASKELRVQIHNIENIYDGQVVNYNYYSSTRQYT